MLSRPFIIYVLILLLAGSCNRDMHSRHPQVALTNVANEPAYIVSYDTVTPIGDDAPNYEQVKDALLHPFTVYDSSNTDYYITKFFWQRDKEIERNKVLYKNYGLPADAKIIETQDLHLAGVSNRVVLLWMTDVSVHIEDEMYVCPTVTTGLGYYSGRVHFSLVNTKDQKVINTITLFTESKWVAGDNTSSGIDYSAFYTIPFSILNPKFADELAGLKYHAIGGTDSTDGIAQVLYLEDYNGDGNKLEFALYQQENCMYCSSILFGYSKKLDRLINYPVHYTILETLERDDLSFYDTIYNDTQRWVGHSFIFKANLNGDIAYIMDYRGRGGSMVRDSIHYNATKECFEGVLDMRQLPEDSATPIPWYTTPYKK